MLRKRFYSQKHSPQKDETFRKGEGPLPPCCVANGEKQRSGGAVRRVNRGSDRAEAPFGRTVPGAFRGSKEARVGNRGGVPKKWGTIPRNRGANCEKLRVFILCARDKRCKGARCTEQGGMYRRRPPNALRSTLAASACCVTSRKGSAPHVTKKRRRSARSVRFFTPKMDFEWEMPWSLGA